MNQNEELLAHIAQLTENQNKLMEQLAAIQARPPIDPFKYYKTPDPIKNISTFSGNRRETLAWIKEAEEALDLFLDCKEEPIFIQLVKAVKSKIVGEAKEILIAAGNPSGWPEIKEVLINSYGDKRDLTSHIQSLFYITQGKKTPAEFYNKIKQIDTAIKSTANSMTEFCGATKQINTFIGLMSTTRFIDGLNDSLSMIVRSHKPESLEEAYTYATQYTNAAYRQKLERNSHKTLDNRKTFAPYESNRATNNTNPFNTVKPGPSGTSTKYGNKPHSGKFQSKYTDDDVSMKTRQSKMQVNNHEQKPPETDANTGNLDSDDDGYFVSDELNFHLDRDKGSRT